MNTLLFEEIYVHLDNGFLRLLYLKYPANCTYYVLSNANEVCQALITKGSVINLPKGTYSTKRFDEIEEEIRENKTKYYFTLPKQNKVGFVDVCLQVSGKTVWSMNRLMEEVKATGFLFVQEDAFILLGNLFQGVTDDETAINNKILSELCYGSVEKALFYELSKVHVQSKQVNESYESDSEYEADNIKNKSNVILKSGSRNKFFSQQRRSPRVTTKTKRFTVKH